MRHPWKGTARGQRAVRGQAKATARKGISAEGKRAEPARWGVLPRGRPVPDADSQARRLLRRLIPASILVPIVAGLLRWEGEQAGLFGTGVGLTLMVSLMVIGMTSLVLWVARQVVRHERTLGEAEHALADERLLLEAVLEASGSHIYFKDTKHRFVRVSPSLIKHFGLSDVAEL